MGTSRPQESSPCDTVTNLGLVGMVERRRERLPPLSSDSAPTQLNLTNSAYLSQTSLFFFLTLRMVLCYKRVRTNPNSSRRPTVSVCHRCTRIVAGLLTGSADRASAPGSEATLPGADEFLPALILLVKRANPPGIHSTLEFVQVRERASFRGVAQVRPRACACLALAGRRCPVETVVSTRRS